jgi:mono/diheme cytochrome c family protein
VKKRTQTFISIAGVIFVIAGLYAVLGFMVLPKGNLVAKQNKAWEQSQKAPSDPTVFPTVKGKVIPGLNLEDALESSPKAQAEGKKLFDADCAACHGQKGKGDGPAAVALTPKPRNFTSAKGWTNGYTLVDIFRTLSVGVKGTAMGDYNTLTPRQRFDLAHYVQSFGKFDHGKADKVKVAALNKQFHLTEGVHQPNKVAVPTIMQHMEAEYKGRAPVSGPSASDTSEGAELYRRVVKNPRRAAIVLARVPDWRTNLQNFVNGVSAVTPSSGFSASVDTLSMKQWQALQAELAGLIPQAPDKRGDS